MRPVRRGRLAFGSPPSPPRRPAPGDCVSAPRTLDSGRTGASPDLGLPYTRDLPRADPAAGSAPAASLRCG
ncbi:hypothetical protein GCM10022226_02900 [Sphaerisporangium flaviroseum]|uniref:Uncharacterized protein n=1 Tax=Sphaerisporangium flaviroseum TaxID=509199 RepID=A0ABP7H8B7_9ACTN